jgi:transposase
MDDHTFDPKTAKLRRFEVITGTGRRRRWPTAVKARIVAESFAPGVQVSDVARRHDLRPQQLFGWRREAREGRLAMPGVEVPTFVPILANLASGTAAARSVSEAESSIEIELRGVVVRVRGRTATGALGEVLAAVKSVT